MSLKALAGFLVVALGAFAGDSPANAAPPLAPKSGQTVTLLIPRASFEGRYAPSVATSLAATIAHAGDTVSVGGLAGWRSLGFPSGLEARVRKVRIDARQRTAEVELSFGPHQSPVTLRFSGVGKDELAAAFGEVAMEGPRSGDAVQRALAATRRRLADTLFEKSLPDTTAEVRLSLVEGLDTLLQARSAALVTIQGRLTLAADLGECDTTYNAALLDKASRAARAADERILPAVRILGRSLGEIPGIESLKLVARVASRDFADEGSQPASEVLEAFVPAPVASRYAAGQIAGSLVLQESLTLLDAVPTPLSPHSR